MTVFFPLLGSISKCIFGWFDENILTALVEKGRSCVVLYYMGLYFCMFIFGSIYVDVSINYLIFMMRLPNIEHQFRDDHFKW